jgi:predicted transcriptional regulator
MTERASVQALEELGFTTVEAEVYIHLLHNSPATGYQIAMGINRTKGAAYKVLASLAARGAVEVDSGKTAMWRAVPASEFLKQLERRFLKGKRKATEALSKIQPSPPDYRIYQLQTVEQVYERARRMLETCEETVYIDAYPSPMSYMGKEMREATGRGVKLNILTYNEPVDIPGSLAVTTCEFHPAPNRFPVRWLSMAVDAREYLVAALGKDEDKVLEAFWSASPIFAYMFSSYMQTCVLSEEIGVQIYHGGDFDSIKEFYEKFFTYNIPYSAPGFKDLLKRFGVKQDEDQSQEGRRTT